MYRNCLPGNLIQIEKYSCECFLIAKGLRRISVMIKINQLLDKIFIFSRYMLVTKLICRQDAYFSQLYILQENRIKRWWLTVISILFTRIDLLVGTVFLSNFSLNTLSFKTCLLSLYICGTQWTSLWFTFFTQNSMT